MFAKPTKQPYFQEKKVLKYRVIVSYKDRVVKHGEFLAIYQPLIFHFITQIHF